ncbi:MAG: hypothetical protein JXR70_10460, partial [Spirochaetales bacterium]|nr:hypothetical protein [Spirochaetales bacterium]
SKEDVRRLNPFRKNIDELIKNGDTAYVHLLNQVFSEKIISTLSFLEEEKNKCHEWISGDSIVLSDYEIFSDERNRKLKWQKFIRYQTLLALKNSNDTILLSASGYNKARKQMINQYICKYSKILDNSDGTAGYIHHTLLKSIASAFDPHTTYLSALESNYFFSHLSKERYSFGLFLVYNEYGQVEVSELTPGGAAWNSNKINAGDIIIGIQYDNKNINLDCGSIGEVENVFLSEVVAEAEFKIRKKNGTELSVKLTKTVLDVEDNTIQSFILEGPRKIGYMYLPSFYTDFSAYDSGRGCSDDIAKEILRLKRVGIDGLIFDVRDNGGGSVDEALKLSGIFVNYGALAISDSRDEDPFTFNDRNRGVLYADPLLILQNEQSASASELFAGVLQDYNRAIVVGASSFGKGTSQNIFELSFGHPPKEGGTDLVKITTGKFFRVDGSSHQNIGIIPDIFIPSLSLGSSVGERNYPNSLSNQEIEKRTYYYPLDSLPLTELRKLSDERIQNDPTYKNVCEIDSLIVNACKSISLGTVGYEDFLKKVSVIKKKITPQQSVYTVSSLNVISGIGSINEDCKSVMQSIKEDSDIRESYNVITDLINIYQNTNP